MHSVFPYIVRAQLTDLCNNQGSCTSERTSSKSRRGAVGWGAGEDFKHFDLKWKDYESMAWQPIDVAKVQYSAVLYSTAKHLAKYSGVEPQLEYNWLVSCSLPSLRVVSCCTGSGGVWLLWL